MTKVLFHADGERSSLPETTGWEQDGCGVTLVGIALHLPSQPSGP